MAKLQIFEGGQDFSLALSRLGDKTNAIIEKALEAGGGVMLDKVQGNLRSAIGSGTKRKSESTGELAASLGKSPVKVDSKGVSNIKIGFREPRRGGGVNAMIANVLEHGRHGQPPRPFLKPAISAAQQKCVDTMAKTLEEEINRI